MRALPRAPRAPCHPRGRAILSRACSSDAQIFEKLGDNLLTLIKRYDYRGVPLPYVRAIARQVLVGLDYLHREREIIHTDLKPENVLLCAPLPPPLGGRRRSSTAGGAAAPKAGAAAAAANGALTKNQKKKLKRKAKKGGAETPASGAGTPRGEADTPGGSEGGEEAADGADADAAAAAAGDADAAAAPDAAAAASPDAPPRCDAPASAGSSPPPSSDAAPSDAPSAAAAAADADAAVAATFALGCKIVDLGNACWTYKQFTNDIQTRQYRCPEVLLGAPYSTPADMWSLACIIFELVTGDLLFDPRSGEDYERDEDHLALMIELVGRIPRRVALGGKYSRDFFSKTGELKHIRKLRMWPLERVLQDKYKLPLEEAVSLASFLEPMLQFAPESRATAAVSLQHAWLRGAGGEAAEGAAAAAGAAASPSDAPAEVAAAAGADAPAAAAAGAP